MQQADICIAGAGIIGLSLALELERRGASVTVLERDTPLLHASQAAAGMLAAHDPENPPELLPLAEFSLALYPAFLSRIESLSGQFVPFQTSLTYQSVQSHIPSKRWPLPSALTPGSYTFTCLQEHSLDPRQLAPALLAAVRATSIRILNRTALRAVTQSSRTLQLQTTAETLECRHLVHATGPWSFPPVAPRKGQMLAVRIPDGCSLDYVVRTPDIYIVPRLYGPRAGQAVIGATVEDAGFSTHTDSAPLAQLRARAASLLPALADEAAFPTVAQWAGLRPHTPDHLPLLGPLNHEAPNQFIATGHYRNGILLAPATAHILAQILADESPAVDLAPFDPARFDCNRQDCAPHPIFAHTT